MKPTISSQPSHRQNFPLTHYNYQSTLQDSHATVAETRDTHVRRGFWKLSSDYFFSSEVKIEYAAEVVLFSVITALSASQIFSTLMAMMRFWRNY